MDTLNKAGFSSTLRSTATTPHSTLCDKGRVTEMLLIITESTCNDSFAVLLTNVLAGAETRMSRRKELPWAIKFDHGTESIATTTFSPSPRYLKTVPYPPPFFSLAPCLPR